MSVAGNSRGEGKRLEALASYEILDTSPEAVFDAFVRIAAEICGVRIATLSFIDESHEWFKARIGIGAEAIERGAGFADYVLAHSGIFEVPDAAADERFSQLALVRDEPHLRFYAGVGLRSPQGEVIGVFSVMSRRPHSLRAPQRNGLQELATTIMSALEARRALRNLFSESRAAQEQVALLLSAIDVAGDVILVYRVDPKNGELALVYMNQAYTRQTGYTLKDAVGRTLQEFRQAMPDDPGMTQLRDAVKRGEPAQMEIISYRSDGTSFWNQVTLHPIRAEQGVITHWISVERDVTQAVERESRLEDQQARLLILTSVARRLFSTLDARALVARLEEALRELIGGSCVVYAVLPDGRSTPTRDLQVPEQPLVFGDDLIGRAAQTRGHVTDQSGFRAAASAGMGGALPHVIEVQAGSGSTLRAGDLFVLDLVAEYFGVAVRNASLVNELEERRSAILELNQVKTDLIAMLAHDFKSPLTSIVGFAELAMELGEINDDQRTYLESIKRLALRLADLASDTLAFSRLERNEIDLSLGEVDLGEMARETARTFEEQRHIGVSVTGTAMVRGDERRLRQVLYNLVENAIKYSAEDSPVELKVRTSPEYVRIAVTDKGIGVPKKEIAQIFGRFSRASNARRLQISGTGFGLYVARQIAELHGGTIAVSSTEGKGSTFTVDLPLAAANQAGRPLSVVVLERERETRSFVAHALREAGVRVHLAPNADDLIAWLADNAPDRLVVDLDQATLSSAQQAAIEHEQERSAFGIISLGSRRKNPFARAIVLSKPFLVQDLLLALGSTRSLPA